MIRPTAGAPCAVIKAWRELGRGEGKEALGCSPVKEPPQITFGIADGVHALAFRLEMRFHGACDSRERLGHVRQVEVVGIRAIKRGSQHADSREDVFAVGELKGRRERCIEFVEVHSRVLIQNFFVSTSGQVRTIIPDSVAKTSLMLLVAILTVLLAQLELD
jgi:hypothetical protein